MREGFEVWQTILPFDYDFLSKGSVDRGDQPVISLEKPLFLKAPDIKKPKYEEGLRPMVDRIIKD